MSQAGLLATSASSLTKWALAPYQSQQWVRVGVEGGEQSQLAKQLRFYPEDFSDFNNSDFSRRGQTEPLLKLALVEDCVLGMFSPRARLSTTVHVAFGSRLFSDVGAGPCTVVCLAAPLHSHTRCPQHSAQLMTINISRHCQVSPGRQNHPPLGTIGLLLSQEVHSPFCPLNRGH